MATIYDDTYNGPRWRYGLRYRPWSASGAPKDVIIGSGRPHSDYPHGTVDYPRCLTDRECEGYELDFLGPVQESAAEEPLTYAQADHLRWRIQEDGGMAGACPIYTAGGAGWDVLVYIGHGPPLAVTSWYEYHQRRREARTEA